MPTTDADLLAAFARDRGEGAFAELVRRHGPLVQGVCRRVLADAPEADDAFQATFLVLARKAGKVRDPARLGPWLYGVAVKVAGKAKAARQKRQRRERPMSDTPAPPPSGERDSDWADVRPLLDGEVARLPDKLRAALVLCELQGVPRDEAAGRLGVPAGTLSSRLARAKDLLRTRLTRRGLTLSAGGLGLVLSEAGASAAVPAEVVHDTAAAAVAVSPQGGSIMVKLFLSLLAAGGVTAGGLYLADPSRPGLEALQGEWVLDHTATGFVVPVLGRSFTVRGDTLYPDPKEAGGWAQIRLSAGQSPQWVGRPPGWIDLTADKVPGLPDGHRITGLYAVDGDRLTLNLAFRGQTRPHAINAPTAYAKTGRETGDQLADYSHLWVMRRVDRSKPDPAADLPYLQGRWRVVAAEADGRPVPPAGDMGWFVFHHADQLEIIRPAGKAERSRLSLDATRSPKWFDLTADAKPADRPQTLRGLYTLDGDTLTVGWTHGDRPVSLDAGQLASKFKLEREKLPAGKLRVDQTHPNWQKLWGRWRVTEAAEGGKSVAAGGTLTFAPNELRFDRPGAAPRAVLYHLTQVDYQTRIDLLEQMDARHGGVLNLVEGGVYDLDGDRLTLAFGRQGNPVKRPPTAANHPADPPVRWFRLERVPE